MDFDRRAADIIEGAEKALAALAAEAMGALDYPRATALLAMAQRVGAAARADDDDSAPATALPPAAETNGDQRSHFDTAERGHLALPPSSSSRTSKKAGSTYPRFKREDNTLVKIGWSKSDRSTYEHRSPRDVLDRLVARISETARSGERFTTEQIMPLHDADGSELPSYQAYLCLAWLVAQGLIERHGRQGYTVADLSVLPSAVEQAWSALPKR